MTWEQWERVKNECRNNKMIAFAGMSKEAQKAMWEASESMGASVDWIGSDGSWEKVYSPMFFQCNTYRINPSWPGPSKPAPVVEYEDLPVCDHGGLLFYETETELRERVSDAIGRTDFAGYVMPDGRIRSRLIFDSRPDRTYRLRVPKAVRLIKEVAE